MEHSDEPPDDEGVVCAWQVMPDVAKGLHASLLGNYVTWTEYVGFTIPFGKAG